MGAQVLADALLQGPTLDDDGALVASNDTKSTVCPDGFQDNSNMRITGGGYILCMRMVDWPPAPSDKVVTDVVVKTGPADRSWGRIKCPRAYTKMPFGNSDVFDPTLGTPQVPPPQVPLGVPDTAPSLSAMCLRFETTGAARGRRRRRRLVAGLTIVGSKAQCASLGRQWRLVRGNIGAAWPGNAPSFLCMTTLGRSP